MKKIPDESGLLKELSSLPREMAPRHDVWPQIAAHVSSVAPGSGPGARRTRAWPLAAAASVLVVIAVGLLLKNQWNPPEVTAPEADAAAVLELPPGKSYSTGSPTSGELEYQAALKEFMALDALQGSDGEPKPEWIENGWGALRQVELELTAAIRSEPDNDFLKSRLTALRARQIELLQQIAAVDSASWRNNT
jgi:hypothetical protein